MSEASAKSVLPATLPACARCHQDLARHARFCPFCGSEQSKSSRTGVPVAGEGKIIKGNFSRNSEVSPAGSEPTLVDATAIPPVTPHSPISDQTPQALVAAPASATPSAGLCKSQPEGTLHRHQAAASRPASAVPQLSETAIPGKRRKSRRRLLLLVIILLFGVWGLVRLVPPPSRVSTTPTERVSTFYVTRDDATVRNAPTAIGSDVITKLARGVIVTGIWIRSAAGSKWLKLSAGPFKGDYVWERSVSDKVRPSLIQSIDGYMSVNQVVQLRSAPDLSGAVLQNVRPGVRLYVYGSVEGGWLEIPLRHGGVGYLPPSAFQ